MWVYMQIHFVSFLNVQSDCFYQYMELSIHFVTKYQCTLIFSYVQLYTVDLSG